MKMFYEVCKFKTFFGNITFCRKKGSMGIYKGETCRLKAVYLFAKGCMQKKKSKKIRSNIAISHKISTFAKWKRGYCRVPSFLWSVFQIREKQIVSFEHFPMIDKALVTEYVGRYCEGKSIFLVDLKISTDNRIVVFIDGDNGVTIEDCRELSRSLEKSLDRDKEDFDLTVSSYGIDHPLKTLRQYRKNVGRPVVIVTTEGEKHIGTLSAVEEDLIILTPEIVRKKSKTSEEDEIPEEIPFAQIKETRVQIRF